jgi:serine/threonine protein kinase
MRPPGEPQGRLIDGRYRLSDRIGAGGMGEVWRAVDERLNRAVAIKLIGSAVGTQNPMAMSRFRREAKITARLSGHPNIVTVHDFGEDPVYVVMELVEGTALNTLVRRGGPPATAEVLSWGRQICDALATAHAAGIVHRDLKPSNLILTRRTTIKVLDFGIAAFLKGTTDHTRITGSGAILGTPPYMAPEQIQGGGVSPRTDLYSLGCLLYELVTGEPPFGTGPVYELLQRHLTAEPTPREDRPDLPLELDRLILDLLAKDPAARPVDAATVRERLDVVTAPPRVEREGDRAEPSSGLRFAVVFD